jgi:hypothetical protein
MFAATPRLRDVIDLRTALLVAAVALAAFGLQLGLLAGTVASPLGEAIANLETIPQVDTAPPGRALARASGDDERMLDGLHLDWEPGAASARPLPEACLVRR